MKVLVTGGAGYIGSHTCKALRQNGHQPVVFDNLATGNKSLVKYGPFVHGDIRDSLALTEAIKAHQVEAVIHFAACAYVGESMVKPRLYYNNNVLGTLSLLDVMQEMEITKLVFSSSCATYGIPESIPISEDSPQRPINPYGYTKLVGEHMMRDVVQGEKKLNCIALRYFNASGADPAGEIGELHDPETHLIPLVLLALSGKNDNFRIMGDDYPTPDGTCIRDYLHVTDLANAHVKALDKLGPEPNFEAYNLGTGNGVSVKQLVEIAQQVTGVKLSAETAPRRPGDPPELVADPKKANEQLGWYPEFSDIETILATANQWMKSEENIFRFMGIQ